MAEAAAGRCRRFCLAKPAPSPRFGIGQAIRVGCGPSRWDSLKRMDLEPRALMELSRRDERGPSRNRGRFDDGQFAVLPEAGITLSNDLAQCLKAALAIPSSTSTPWLVRPTRLTRSGLGSRQSRCDRLHLCTVVDCRDSAGGGTGRMSADGVINP